MTKPNPVNPTNEAHPLALIRLLYSIGYTLTDLLPAFPGKDEAYIDRMMADNAALMNRQVMPYGLLGIKPSSNEYCTVTEPGFRHSYREQPWPPPEGYTSVFCFGGSTMLGFCVEDADTIPSNLQKICDDADLPVLVYNFGSGSYTSRHCALRYLDLLDRGFVPDVALFLDGFNDCYFTPGNKELVTVFDRLYAAERTRARGGFRQRLAMAWRGLSDSHLQNLRPEDHHECPELVKLCSDLFTESGIHEALARSSSLEDLSLKKDCGNLVGPFVWQRYLSSQSIVEGLSRPHRVKTVSFWQPVPYYASGPQNRIVEKIYYVYWQSAFSALVYRWLQQSKFPGAPENFVDLSTAGDGRKEVLYVDHGHYTGQFSQILAERIFDAVNIRWGNWVNTKQSIGREQSGVPAV